MKNVNGLGKVNDCIEAERKTKKNRAPLRFAVCEPRRCPCLSRSGFRRGRSSVIIPKLLSLFGDSDHFFVLLRPFFACGPHAVLGLQGKIQIVLLLREHTVFNRLPHGAARLVFVGAVAETALPCFFFNIPKNFVKPLFRLANTEFAHARSVHKKNAVRLDKLPMRCCVPPLVVLLANIARAHNFPSEKGVDKR